MVTIKRKWFLFGLKYLLIIIFFNISYQSHSTTVFSIPGGACSHHCPPPCRMVNGRGEILWDPLWELKHPKCWTGWSTNLNQDFREKYQWPQICRWHSPHGKRWRGTKEPVDKSDERASLVIQLVKNPPAMRETWVQSLGWEDPLEKGKATHSSILAWRIPRTVQSTGSQRVRYDWVTFTHISNDWWKWKRRVKNLA